MKRFIFIMAMIVCITFAGQSETKISKEELRQGIAAVNASLPEPFGNLGTMVSATINRDTVVMKYIFSDDFIRMVANLGDAKKNYKDAIITQCTAVFDVVPETRVLFEAIEENGFTLKLIFDKDKNQNFFEVVLTPVDLKKTLDEKPDYKKIVDMNLAQGKLLYPIDMGPMTMTDCYIRDNKVYYLLEVDESQLDMKALNANKDNIKQLMINQLRQSGDMASIMQLYYNASAGYDSVYEYKGSKSGESIYVELSRAETLGIVEEVK